MNSILHNFTACKKKKRKSFQGPTSKSFIILMADFLLIADLINTFVITPRNSLVRTQLPLFHPSNFLCLRSCISRVSFLPRPLLFRTPSSSSVHPLFPFSTSFPSPYFFLPVHFLLLIFLLTQCPLLFILSLPTSFSSLFSSSSSPFFTPLPSTSSNPHPPPYLPNLIPLFPPSPHPQSPSVTHLPILPPPSLSSPFFLPSPFTTSPYRGRWVYRV